MVLVGMLIDGSNEVEVVGHSIGGPGALTSLVSLEGGGLETQASGDVALWANLIIMGRKVVLEGWSQAISGVTPLWVVLKVPLGAWLCGVEAAC